MTLRLHDVGKRYGSNRWGVRHVDLTATTGVLGLLGPNGAGKSTLLELVSTAMRPTEGRISWKGTDTAESPDAVRSVVGYLPQEFGVYPNLSADEFLEYMAALKGISRQTAATRIDELLDAVNLADARDRRIGSFSGGMRQRVGIAQALLNDPDLLVVDEPTVGLDPEERVRFRNLVSQFGRDRVVVLSTHIVSDIEATADDVVIIDDGRLVAHDTPEALLARAEGSVWEWTVPVDDLPMVKRAHRVSATTRRSDGVRVRAVTDSPQSTAEPVDPALEDAYLHVTDPGGRR